MSATGYEIADAIILPFLAVGLFFLVRFLCRFVRQCYREMRDCIRVYRRGVLTPDQVYQEFVLTTGRQPTVAEVRDLYDMIKAEHDHARNNLLLVGGAVLGTGLLLHEERKGLGL